MSRGLFNWRASCSLALLSLLLVSCATAVNVYLSKQGSDSNSGLSPSDAVLTLNHAVSVINSLPFNTSFASGQGEGVELICGGGIYAVPETVVLAPGSVACAAAHPLTITAQHGSTTTFSGGRIFNGSAFVKLAEAIYASPVLPLDDFPQAMVRNAWGASCGVRRMLAETPVFFFRSNISSLLLDGDSAAPMLLLPKAAQVVLQALNGSSIRDSVFVEVYHCAATTISRVASYDAATGWMTLQGTLPVDNSSSSSSRRDAAACRTSGGGGGRFRLQNIPVVLPSPNGSGGNLHLIDVFHPRQSFAFDPITRRVIYRQSQGEEAYNVVPDFIFPRLETILRTAAGGCAGLHITSGVQFTNTDSFLEERCMATGCSGASATALPTATLELHGLVDSSFTGVQVWATGGYGIWLRNGSRNVTLSGMEIFDLGAGGVRLGESDTLLDILPNTAIAIEDSWFSYGGQVLAAGCAVLLQAGNANCSIQHISALQFKSTAISIGWETATEAQQAVAPIIQDIVASYNKIAFIGLAALSSVACILQRSAIDGLLDVSHNLCSDVQSYAPGGGWGLVADASSASSFSQPSSSSGVPASGRQLWRMNVVYRAEAAPFLLVLGGSSSSSSSSSDALQVVNNVFAFPQSSGDEQSQPSSCFLAIEAPRQAKMSLSVTVQRNIFLLRNTSATALLAGTDFAAMPFNMNLYWSYSVPAEALTFPTWGGSFASPSASASASDSFAAWQALGQDTNSAVADPMLTDVSTDDFANAAPGSPVYALGIQLVNTSLVGPRGSPPPEAPRRPE